ncbi:putative alkaline phosphatase [Streptomyces venezuelae]|nr:putative alkaline phosphatase [Streptomyces venezuelae]CUM41754.1 FIG00665196: hypothetical protein [Streptomyces venezuelae]
MWAFCATTRWRRGDRAGTTPGAPVTTAASYVTEAGNPGLTPA